ncbi:LysE family translocator [Formicincola oecophyllae]|uniref:LysE family translocator n=2 Tax=Formicincola oecophyllae TaxID=2558361 RepID=A0A4Y6UCS4_9PROT|nr:LysE family translocator [Formicincola oecophyllae]
MMAPGLDTVLVIRTATAEGGRAAMGVVGGICCGVLVWGLAAAFGFTALVAASPLAFNILKVAGALYLVWLGLQLIGKSCRALAQPGDLLGGVTPPGKGRQPAAGLWRSWRVGFMSNLLNPGFGLVVLTLFPQFVPAHAPVAHSMMVLTCVQVAIAAAWFGLLAAVGLPLGRLLARPVVVRWFDILTGVVFLLFAAQLALAHAPH